MEKSKRELSQELEDLVRCAVAPLNAGYAFGCLVVTSTPEVTEIDEIQLYTGSNPWLEFVPEIERQLSGGRIVLALCPMMDVGKGNVHFEIHLARPYCEDFKVNGYVRDILVAQLGMG